MSEENSVKKTLLFSGKLIVSALLLVYLLRKYDLHVIWGYLKHAGLSWIIIGILLLIVGRLITGWRWKILLDAQGIHIPFKTLLCFLFVSSFFNVFLPSTIGGDAIRASDSSRHSKLPAESILTIVIETIMGLCALATIAFIAFLLGISSGRNVQQFLLPLVLLLALTYACMILILNQHLMAPMISRLRKLRLNRFADRLNKVSLVLSRLKENKRAMFWAAVLSLLLQVNVVIYTYVVSLSLGLRIPVIEFFTIVPIVLLILILPISINGIGLRENAFALMFAAYMTGEEAVALSWVLLGLTLFIGAIGGLFYIGRH